MKIPKLPFSLPAITGPFKKVRDEPKELVQEQEADRKSPLALFSGKKLPAQVRIEEQLRAALSERPPPAGSSREEAPRPRSLLETRHLMAGTGQRSHVALPADTAKVTAESAAARKMASAQSRLRAPSRRNLFLQNEVETVQQALQSWVLDARADAVELKRRGEARTIFIKVLHDPTMNIPTLLTGQFDALPAAIRDAIRKVEAYHAGLDI